MRSVTALGPFGRGRAALILHSALAACSSAKTEDLAPWTYGSTRNRLSEAGAPQGANGSGSPGSSDAGGNAGGNADASDPFAAAAVCTSGVTWTNAQGQDELMAPGAACKGCHTEFTISGTVYPTAHEPENCRGTAAASIVITDNNNAETTLTPNAAGNFYSTQAFALPIKAKVVVGATSRPMTGTIANGDCNSCHTQTGASAAPGRVIPP